MLHALSATIGTLAILASIVAKLVKPSSDASAHEVAGSDGARDPVAVLPCSPRRDRPCCRVRRRVRVRSRA